MLRDVGQGLVSRWLSSLLVAAYVVGAGVMFGLLTSIETGGFCLLSWCCIWFPICNDPLR